MATRRQNNRSARRTDTGKVTAHHKRTSDRKSSPAMTTQRHHKLATGKGTRRVVGATSGNTLKPPTPSARSLSRQIERVLEDRIDNAIIDRRLADPMQTPIPWEQAKRTLGL